MSIERQAEMVSTPPLMNRDVTRAKQVTVGRKSVERYAERLQTSAKRLRHGPEASELLCAVAELHEGILDHNPAQAARFYHGAIEAFALSRPAHAGVRRLARDAKEIDTIRASLQRDIANATGQRAISLRQELARTLLYQADRPNDALLILEEIDALRSARAREASEAESAGPGWMGVELFFLWEEALWATSQWQRYEKLLREALINQRSNRPFTQVIERRLLHLYQYILPDAKQAGIIIQHLLGHSHLDPELVELALRRMERNAQPQEMVALLNRALEAPQCAGHATLYRMLLADIARHHFDDIHHAVDIIRAGVATPTPPSDVTASPEDGPAPKREPILVHELLTLQEERQDLAGILEALGFSLDILEDPVLRADTLHRIGTILSDNLEQEDSAVEVWLEAHRECPTHLPTLRSLGRIYRRREAWAELADLYEGELSASQDDDRWRKHHQLAEIYEDRLGDLEQAFHHYAAVLALRPSDLASLKGAGRVAAALGRWSDLLHLYAAAEEATQDPKQHTYLLDRIAQIAEEHLGDLDTACTALEALRIIDPRQPSAIASLARLYMRLERFADLVDLTDEELSWTTEGESCAALLCRNGEICAEHLADSARAAAYYRRALQVLPTYTPALEALGRLLEQDHKWEELVALGLEEAEQWGDARQALRRLHAVADILESRLGRTDESLALYWRCLDRDPSDRVARATLIRHYKSTAEWEEVARVLEIEAAHGGTAGSPALTLFTLAQVKEHRLNDLEGALDAYQRAFTADPSNTVIMRALLATARRVGASEGPRKTLSNASTKPTDQVARAELLVALAEFSLMDSHDPMTAAGYLEIAEQITPEKAIFASLLAMALAQSGRWSERLRLALSPHRSLDEQVHGLHGAIVTGMPAGLADPAKSILPVVPDPEVSLQLWEMLSPAQRPSYLHLSPEILANPAPHVQDLRRWSALAALLAGDTIDPAKRVLPENKSSYLSLRPELELLAAYYEVTEAWPKVLEVLEVQIESAPSDPERAHALLQRAFVLGKVGRAAEALEAVRTALPYCDFESPIRDDLYDYLEGAKDWDFLAQELRRHLMHCQTPPLQSHLWQRLARVLDSGLGQADEALRALDAAYRSFPGAGAVLPEIAKLAERIGETIIARRALDDFLTYHRPDIEAELDGAHRVVELHIDQPGGDPQRAIAYLENLTARSCEDRRALQVLADAHAKAGDPSLAAEILLRLVRSPYRREDIALWMSLARLYVYRLHEASKGETLLWDLFRFFPDEGTVFTALNELHQGHGARTILAENLRELIHTAPSFAEDPELKRRYLTIVGRILGDELGLWREAQDVYSEAIDAAQVPEPDLSRQRAYALCRVPGERASALKDFLGILANDPFQTDILQSAVELCESAEAYDRARILRQLAALCVPEAGLHHSDAAERPKVDVTRDLPSQTLEKRLLLDELRPLHALLHEAMPIFEALFKESIPRLSAIGGQRARGKDDLGEVFANAAARLNLGQVKVYLGHDESPLPMVFHAPPAFWMPSDRWGGMSQAERRHWAGYAGGVLWTGLAPLIHLDGQALWQILDGIHYLVTGDGIQGRTAYTIEASEKVKSPWYRRARKEISQLITEAGAAAHKDEAHAWPQWIHATGDRAGLLFSGDLGASVRAMLAGEGWRSEASEAGLRHKIDTHPRVRHLLAFALSEDYLHLRHAAGLAQRPSAVAG